MKYFAISSLATLASAVSVDLAKRDSALAVELKLTGNTAVEASITNTGAEDLKVLKTGSFLGNIPVEKVQVFQSSSKVDFDGVKVRVQTVDLSEDAFQTIAAGETVTTSFDIAQMHDLSAGGDFDVKSVGSLSYAEAGSTKLAGVVSYSSNTVTASIDGAEAGKTRRSFRRSVVQSDCTGTKKTATVNALANCRTLALAASSAAASNTAKVNEYFKSTTSSTISTLQSVFTKAASECGSSTSGVSKTYCTDPYGYCESNVLAYTIPSLSIINNCALYFSALPALTKSCHAQDQATTTLHEVTHLTQIKGTDDLGYGYTAATKLSTANALNNADSYALFANAIYAGC